MINGRNLDLVTDYKIVGENGIWRYESFESNMLDGGRYIFARDAANSSRKVRVKLTNLQVQRKVRVVSSPSINLDSLESMMGM